MKIKILLSWLLTIQVRSSLIRHEKDKTSYHLDDRLPYRHSRSQINSPPPELTGLSVDDADCQLSNCRHGTAAAQGS